MARWALTVRRVLFLAVSCTAHSVSFPRPFHLLSLRDKGHGHNVVHVAWDGWELVEFVRSLRDACARLGFGLGWVVPQ